MEQNYHLPNYEAQKNVFQLVLDGVEQAGYSRDPLIRNLLAISATLLDRIALLEERVSQLSADELYTFDTTDSSSLIKEALHFAQTGNVV